MVLVKPKDYIVTATYYINGETKVDGVKFNKSEYRNSVSQALELAKSWNTPHIKLSLSRRILFEKGNGHISDQDPIDEDITLGQLEEFASKGENLPKKQFYIPMTLQEARIEKIFVEAVTGKPAEFALVN
jgi:hypothetical protein